MEKPEALIVVEDLNKRISENQTGGTAHFLEFSSNGTDFSIDFLGILLFSSEDADMPREQLSNFLMLECNRLIDDLKSQKFYAEQGCSNQ
jgi:hypothetical protein